MTALDVERMLTDNEGQLPVFAPGTDFPFAYLTEVEDEYLCASCATAEIRRWQQNESDNPPIARLCLGGPHDYSGLTFTCAECEAEIYKGVDDRDYAQRLEDAERGGNPVNFTPKP